MCIVLSCAVVVVFRILKMPPSCHEITFPCVQFLSIETEAQSPKRKKKRRPIICLACQLSAECARILQRDTLFYHSPFFSLPFSFNLAFVSSSPTFETYYYYCCCCCCSSPMAWKALPVIFCRRCLCVKTEGGR